MRPLVVIGAALVLAGCGGGDEPPEAAPTSVTATTSDTIEVTGEIAISAYDAFLEGDSVGSGCTGDGGYDDIQAGAQVVVSDEAGATIAVSELKPGRVRLDPFQCWFAFTVEDVPGEHEFYSVEVSGRGELEYSRDEVVEPLAFTLG